MFYYVCVPGLSSTIPMIRFYDSPLSPRKRESDTFDGPEFVRLNGSLVG